MTVLATRSTPEDSRSADWLWIAAHSVLGSVPVVMAVASRASTLVLIIAAALTVAAILAEGRLRQWLAEAVAALTSPLGLAILAFLGFAALSTTWSAAPRLSLATLAEFGAALGGAFIVGLVLPRRMPQRRPLMLAASLGLACAAILLQLWTDSAIRRAVALRADDFIYNRPTLTVLVLTIPLAWMLLRGGHRRTGWLVLAAAGATIVISVERGGRARRPGRARRLRAGALLWPPRRRRVRRLPRVGHRPGAGNGADRRTRAAVLRA